MSTKILMSLVTIGLVASVIGVGSYAYFSDTETSSGNTLTNGVLNLIVNGHDGCPGCAVVTVGDLKPSFTRYSDDIVLTIQNNPGKLYKRITGIQCENNGLSEPEAVEEKDCPKYDLDKYTWFDLERYRCGRWETAIPDYAVTMKDLVGKWIYLGEYQPSPNEALIKQSFHLKSEVTNWAQTDRCLFSEEFMVLQTNDPGPSPSECFNGCGECLVGKGSSVVSVAQGKNKDGTDVIPTRSVPEHALLYEAAQDESSFFSLGFGGEIVIGFDNRVVNDLGYDVKVIEDTWATTYPLESADVYAKKELADAWTYLGEATNTHFVGIHTTTEFDLGAAGLDWAKYFRVIDTTDPDDFPGQPKADGFDLNAIVAEQDCEDPCD